MSTFCVAVLASSSARADVGDQTAKFLASDGTTGDFFGFAVAISGTTAIVGASGDDDDGTDSGSAYLFDTNTGQQITKLLPSDGMANNGFGRSVAISASTAIVGANLDDDNGTDSGSAYLFETTTGLQIAKLLASDGASLDQFGFSVGISGTTAIVGAFLADGNGFSSGAVYVFDTTSGNEVAKLVPSDGILGDSFGFSVGISGTTAIISASGDDDNGNASGSAYLFDTETGSPIAKLLASDGVDGDQFGISVAISGTTAIVGAYLDESMGSAIGSAYLFDARTGASIAKLLPGDGACFDHFGFSVGISGQTAIVGANQEDDNGNSSGAAYLFDASSGIELAKLLAGDGAINDQLGYSTAISGLTAVAGAVFDDDNGFSTGSAYLFDATNNAVPASSTVRNGSGLNAGLFSSVSDPILGMNWVTAVDASGHSASVVAVVVFEQPSRGIFISGGELLVDLSSPLVTCQVLAHQGSIELFSVPVPLDTSLFGATFSAQAAVLGSPGFELSNALDLVAGI